MSLIVSALRAVGLRAKARAGVRGFHPQRALRRLPLLAAAVFGLGAAAPAMALSTGCLAIQNDWGGGVTLTMPEDVMYGAGYDLLAGEQILYEVTSSGSTNTSTSYNGGGGGFTIWQNGGPTPVGEVYAAQNQELNLNDSFVVPANQPYEIYLWVGSGGGTFTAKVTCQQAQPPTVTDARINISGATGTGGTYKIGDTVIATWNNSASGDNNPNVTAVQVDFSQFGGGTGVPAVNNANTWHAFYTLPAGAIEASNLNVRVIASSPTGTTSAWDSSNARVDNVRPTVTSLTVDGSPASTDTGLAFRITFSEPVVNVSTDDFTLVGTGSASGNIVSVSGSSGSLLRVNVAGISGNGTLKVNLNGGTNVFDAAGNTVPAYTTGSTHTVAIPTAPGAPTIGTATAGNGQAQVNFTAPVSNGGSAITTYTATANPGGSTGSCAGPAACVITVGGLTNGMPYTFAVTATNAIGTSTASGASNSVMPKGSQTITFNNPGAQEYGTARALTATASSTLPVTLTSNTGAVCSVTAGTTVRFNTTGSCSITASQAGNGAYNAAANVTEVFDVDAVAPGAPTIGMAVAGDSRADVTFTAPAFNGGEPITHYTVVASPGGFIAIGGGSPLTVNGLTNGTAYTFSVMASNTAGTGQASASSNAVTPAAPQTLTFPNPGPQDYGTSPTLSATASSTLPVTFTANTPAVCTISAQGLLDFASTGMCMITASQAGSAAYQPATASQTFPVNAVVPDAPVVTSAVAGSSSATVNFTVPVSDGGTPIIGYTVTSSPQGHIASGTSSPLIVAGLSNGTAYTFQVTASNFEGSSAPSSPSNAVTPAASQSISFTAPALQTYGTAPTLTATATSGLAVTFAASTPAVCSVTSGGTLAFASTGTCTVTVSQAGDAAWLPASDVSQSFLVNAHVPGAPSAVVATAGDRSAAVAFAAPSDTGGGTISRYTVTVWPADVMPVSGSASPILVSGLTNGQAYTFTVTADTSAGTGPASPASASVTPAGTQTLTFAAPGPQPFDSSPTLTATSDSGLAPVFSSSTPAVCSITPTGVLSFVSAGSCVVSADQPGNSSYLPAARVSHSFNVAAVVPDAPVIGTATLTGPGEVSVVFTAPADSGGSAITQYTVTSIPGGITASGAGSPITLSGLASGVQYTFAVSAINSAGTSAASAASNPVSTATALVAQPVTAAVGYGASATDIVLSISGTPTRVDVVDAPLHGRVAVNGMRISYTPDAGFNGTDRFTYSASDAYGSSPAAEVTLTVSAPVLVLAQPDLPAVSASNAFNEVLTSSGGTAPYRYAVSAGALPAGVTLSSAGVLSGTAVVAGNYAFTITVTDSSSGTPATLSRAYRLDVQAPQVELALPELPDADGGLDYRQALTASGGAAPYRFALRSGRLPAGLVLAETGEISGAPTQAGSFDFDVQVTDANAFTGMRSYRLLVDAVEQAITPVVTTPAAPVFSTGGVFELAASGGGSGNAVVYASATPAVCTVQGSTVTMLAAGSCVITADQPGDDLYAAAAQVRVELLIAASVPVIHWQDSLDRMYGEADFELPVPQSNSPGAFTFSSSNTAVATVNGRMVTLVGEGSTTLTATQAASGSFAAASVELQLVVAARPDPRNDAQVAGVLQAQVDASVRFAQVQQGNIRDRLRQVRTGNNASSFNVGLASAGGRGSPGGALPLGAAAEGLADAMPRLPEGWGAWVAGTATFGRAGRGGGSSDFNTGGITVGADRAVGENLLLGMAGSWGRQDTDFDGSSSSADAEQRSLAAYGLWRAGQHLFVDALLANGQLDFELTRWNEQAAGSARADRTGRQWFGSLTLGYEHRGLAGATLTSYSRYDGHRATLQGYREQGLAALDLAYGRQTVENNSLALGVEGTHAIKGDAGSWRPFWGVEYRKALDNASDVSMNYVQRPQADDYVLAMRSYNDDTLALRAGVDLQLDSGWMFSLLLGHEQGRNRLRSNSIGVQLRLGGMGSGGNGLQRGGNRAPARPGQGVTGP